MDKEFRHGPSPAPKALVRPDSARRASAAQCLRRRGTDEGGVLANRIYSPRWAAPPPSTRRVSRSASLSTFVSTSSIREKGPLSVDALEFAGDEHFTCRYGEDVPCENATNFPFLVAGLNSEDAAADRLPVTIRFTRSEAISAAAELVVLSDSREDGRLLLHFATGEGVPPPPGLSGARGVRGHRRWRDRAAHGRHREHRRRRAWSSTPSSLDADAEFSPAPGRDRLRQHRGDARGRHARSAHRPRPRHLDDPRHRLHAPRIARRRPGPCNSTRRTPEGDWHTVIIEALPPSIVLTLSPELIEFGGQGVGETAIRELRLSSNGTPAADHRATRDRRGALQRRLRPRPARADAPARHPGERQRGRARVLHARGGQRPRPGHRRPRPRRGRPRHRERRLRAPPGGPAQRLRRRRDLPDGRHPDRRRRGGHHPDDACTSVATRAGPWSARSASGSGP